MKLLIPLILFLSQAILSSNAEHIYKIKCLVDDNQPMVCTDAKGKDVNVESMDADPSQLGDSWSITLDSTDRSITVTNNGGSQTAILTETIDEVLSVYRGNYDLFNSGTWIGKITIDRNGGT
jgi:hypothetical protein